MAIEAKPLGGAAGAAIIAGLESLAELGRITDSSTQTLNNWYKNKPALFQTVVSGAVVIKNAQTDNGHVSWISSASEPPPHDDKPIYIIVCDDDGVKVPLVIRSTGNECYRWKKKTVTDWTYAPELPELPPGVYGKKDPNGNKRVGTFEVEIDKQAVQ